MGQIVSFDDGDVNGQIVSFDNGDQKTEELNL